VASFNTLIDDFKKSLDFLKNHPALSASAQHPAEAAPAPPPLYQKALDLFQQHGIHDLTDFLTNPRFDHPAYLATLGILLATVFLAMSWFSRAGGNWGAGRFSPFGRGSNSPNDVTDGDFSYITNEDLAKETARSHHRSSSRNAAPEIVDWDDKNRDRETDVVVFKSGRTNYPHHFPAQSIRDGDVTIESVRKAAAKKLGVDDARRIRMFYKGRNLKHDDRLARDEGLRGDGTGSEILCVIGEASSGSMAPGSEDFGMPGTAHRSWSEGSDEEDTEDPTDSGTGAGTKKKARKRGGRKNKNKKNVPNTGSSTPVGYTSAGAGAEFLPIPSHIPGPRPTSAPPPNASGAATPQTPLGKLDALASKFHNDFLPLCETFIKEPPAEKAKRDFEYKKLSESILAQVLLKLDGVETEGDPDARARRKEVVREVQGMLDRLDNIVKGRT
jgi:hypothetical protein